jgi:hypothetical protein
MKRAAKEQIETEEFRGGAVKDHAIKLANNLAMTLQPHMERLKKANKPKKEPKPGSTAWIGYLERAFHEALHLKHCLDMADNATYEFPWHNQSEPFDKQGMEDNWHVPEEERINVLATLFPGILANLPQGPRYATKAIVLSTVSREFDAKEGPFREDE